MNAPEKPIQNRIGEVDALAPWFHNLHLPGELQTAPDHEFGDFPNCKWQHIAPHLPLDMRGWHALDIGCNAGFYSFQLAARGAAVTGIDHNEHFLRQARWAARDLDPHGRVRFELRDVYSLLRSDEHYDLVLFLGVLYHLRYPLLALDAIARLQPRLLVVQTLTMPESEIDPDSARPFGFEERHRMCEPGWPRMAFIENSFADDATNWWAPNRACVHALLRDVGFAVVAEPAHEIFICEPRPRRPVPWREAQWNAVRGGHVETAAGET